MISFNTFIDNFLGHKVDFDGSYGGQCVDLFRQYVKSVLGYQQPKGVGGACEFWHNYFRDPALRDNYQKIEKVSGEIPKNGDVVLWDKPAGGGFGHVAMFLHGDGDNFTSLDQNWPTLSKVTKTRHDYTNVVGWLRPNKNISTENEPAQPVYQTNVSATKLSDSFKKQFGVNSEEELSAKLIEHVGLSWGNEDPQADPKYSGGFLGADRRSVKALKEELNQAAIYAGKLDSQVEELLSQKKSLETDFKTSLETNKFLQEQVITLRNQVELNVLTDDKSPKDQENAKLKQPSSLLSQLLKHFMRKL